MYTENILISILRLLHVRHTSSYSNKVFREHPHKYNLFGLSKMLSDYRIENVGLAELKQVLGGYDYAVTCFAGDTPTGRCSGTCAVWDGTTVVRVGECRQYGSTADCHCS